MVTVKSVIKLRLMSTKIYRSPGTVVARFVARRTARSATIWAYVFGAYVASKSIGFAKAYPTPEARIKIVHSFSNNIGINALLGQPHQFSTVPGYTAWNSVSILTIVGSIWALLLATKYFRGEETAGRTELSLAGPTTPRRAALNTLLGLSGSLVILYVVTGLIFVIIGRDHSIGFSTTNALYLALTCVSGAVMFMSIGALASQIMPTRSRASSAAAVVFGLSFLIRAMGDITSLHWLLNITPLGWIENLLPLVGSHYIWLLPIALTTVTCSLLTIWLAGRRDLGESIIADHDSAQARVRLLNAPLPAAFRLTRTNSLSWFLGISFIGVFYGVLTKSAVQAFNQAGSIKGSFNRLEQVSQASLSSLYFGIVFFILMAVIMGYTASAISQVREDESEGFVDNFLVRPISRQRWLWGRIGLVAAVASTGCLLGGLSTWLGALNQNAGISFHSMLAAGANMLAPVLFTLGVGVFVMGLRPRLTSLVAYSVLGWSFLLSMISSGVNLSHWILDTSILHQVALAPATAANWHTNFIIIALSATLALIGSWAFNRRDLQLE